MLTSSVETVPKLTARDNLRTEWDLMDKCSAFMDDLLHAASMPARYSTECPNAVGSQTSQAAEGKGKAKDRSFDDRSERLMRTLELLDQRVQGAEATADDTYGFGRKGKEAGGGFSMDVEVDGSNLPRSVFLLSPAAVSHLRALMERAGSKQLSEEPHNNRVSAQSGLDWIETKYTKLGEAEKAEWNKAFPLVLLTAQVDMGNTDGTDLALGSLVEKLVGVSPYCSLFYP